MSADRNLIYGVVALQMKVISNFLGQPSTLDPDFPEEDRTVLVTVFLREIRIEGR